MCFRIQTECDLASDSTAFTAISMTCLGPTVFVGTAAGTVRVIDYPFDSETTGKEYQAHSAPITKVRGCRSVTIL